jgi:CRISPR-associated endonuclease/helicase Cas3
MVVLMDAASGGYRVETGWDPKSRNPVPLVGAAGPADVLVEAEEPIGADPVTFAAGAWVKLRQHLADVEAEVAFLADVLAWDRLPASQREAAVVAGRLHDIGKAHAVFQDTMVRCADDDEQEWVEAGQPWAKSGGSRRARHKRPFFRHELASALALMTEGSAALDGVADPDLVVYLVAAHHGRVRLGIRTVPDEERRGTVLGIVDGEALPAVEIPLGQLPASRLTLGAMALGRADHDAPSWTERALRLLGRSDLGPFRLGLLEALVRVADWRASAGPRKIEEAR